MMLDPYYEYCVIEFLDKPYENIDEYICVPCSWIKLCRNTDRKMYVAYPAENVSSTREQVKNKSKFQKEWNFYFAIVKYGTNSFHDAEMYIMNNRKNFFSSIEACDDESGEKIQIRSSKQSVPSDSTVIKSLLKEKPLKYNRQIYRKLHNTTKTTESEVCSNKEHSDLIIVETSAAVNGIPEEDTENYITSHPKNFSCQPLERYNEEKLSTVHTNCSIQEPQEAVFERSNKFKQNYERATAVYTANTVNQPTKHSDQDQCYLPYDDYLHPNSRIQEILAQRSAEVRGIDLRYWPPRNAIHSCALCNSQDLTCCSSIHSHEYESSVRYEDILPPDPRWQNMLADNANGIDEISYLQSNAKNMQTCPNIARQYSQACEGSDKKSFLTANGSYLWQDANEIEIIVERPMNTNDDQRICPENITKSISCAPQNLINRYYLSPHHPHGYQSSAINRNHRQEQLFKRSTDLNSLEQTVWSIPSPRIHNVYETHAREPNDQKNRTQSTATKRLDFSEGTQLYNPVQNIDKRDSRVKYLDSRAFRPNTTNNIPSAMRTFSSSSNQSCCLFNCSDRKVSPVMMNNFYQDLRMQETLAGGSHAANRTDQTTRNQSSLNNVPPVLVGWLVHDPVKNIDEIVLKEKSIDSRDLLPSTTDNIPSDVRNFSSNHSCSSSNFSTSQQTSPLIKNKSYLNPCIQERLARELNILEDTQPYNHVKNIDKRVPIEKPMDSRAFIPSTMDNIPSPVRNFSCSSNHSCCSSNCSNRKHVSTVINNNSYQDSCMQETPDEKSTQTHYTEESVCAKKDTENRPSAIQNTPKINQLTRHLRQYRFSPIQENSLNKESSTEKIHVGIGTGRISDMNHSRQNNCPESMVTQNLPTSPNGLLDVKAIAEQALLKVFREVLGKLQLSVPSSIFDDIRTTSADINEMTQKVMKTIDHYSELKKCDANIESIDRISNDMTVKPKTTTERKITLNYNYNNDVNDGEGDNDEALKEKRQKRSFVLPPEYKPNDTKWTLKHQRAGSELIELITDSRIYVNKIKFEHCKRVARDHKTLARMLMMEIFSQNALSVCSLTGARANAFDIDGTNVRPGLDEYARIVLLTFVEDHGRSRGWGPFYSHCVLNSIRSKVQEMRAKYG